MLMLLYRTPGLV